MLATGASSQRKPNTLNSKIYSAEDLTIMRPPNAIKPESRGSPYGRREVTSVIQAGKYDESWT
jgi:hypothetical protein